LGAYRGVKSIAATGGKKRSMNLSPKYKKRGTHGERSEKGEPTLEKKKKNVVNSPGKRTETGEVEKKLDDFVLVGVRAEGKKKPGVLQIQETDGRMECLKRCYDPTDGLGEHNSIRTVCTGRRVNTITKGGGRPG